MKRGIQMGLVVIGLVAALAGAQTLIAQGGPPNWGGRGSWGGPGGRHRGPASPQAVLDLSCRQLEGMVKELKRLETDGAAPLPAGLSGFGADLEGVVTSHCPAPTPAQ
jgi:hypothetical protein